jgi:hypothetical protein
VQEKNFHLPIDNSEIACTFASPTNTTQTMYTTADYKLTQLTKKKVDILANHFEVPERWIVVQYADNGYTCVQTLHNQRQYWVKMNGRKIASVAPLV